MADWTWHGVTRAFMSMLGIILLNEIINKESIPTPGKILDRLRTGITRSLKQKGESLEQKEGRENVLKEWKGSNNQTGDMLMIGFRIN